MAQFNLGFGFGLRLDPRIEVRRGNPGNNQARRRSHVEDGTVHVRRSRSAAYGYNSSNLVLVRRRRRSSLHCLPGGRRSPGLEPLRPLAPQIVGFEPQVVEVQPRIIQVEPQIIEVEPQTLEAEPGEEWQRRWYQRPHVPLPIVRPRRNLSMEQPLSEELVQPHVQYLAPDPAPAPAPPPPPVPRWDPSRLEARVDGLAAQNTVLEAELRELREQVAGKEKGKMKGKEKEKGDEKGKEKGTEGALEPVVVIEDAGIRIGHGMGTGVGVGVRN